MIHQNPEQNVAAAQAEKAFASIYRYLTGLSSDRAPDPRITGILKGLLPYYQNITGDQSNPPNLVTWFTKAFETDTGKANLIRSNLENGNLAASREYLNLLQRIEPPHKASDSEPTADHTPSVQVVASSAALWQTAEHVSAGPDLDATGLHISDVSAADPQIGLDTDFELTPSHKPADFVAEDGLTFSHKLAQAFNEGGMGAVYLVHDNRLNRDVVVKVIKDSAKAHPVFVQRFAREIKVLAQLQHPAFARLYHTVRDQSGNTGFCMEYVKDAQELNTLFKIYHYVCGHTKELPNKKLADGTTAKKLADGTTAKLSEQDCVEIINKTLRLPDITSLSCTGVQRKRILKSLVATVYESALGMQFAHELGIVHRDLKPSNIMLDKDGQVKILDVGLAKFVNDLNEEATAAHSNSNLLNVSDRTELGTFLGTAQFCAPEQATGEINSHDSRSDIYGLAATLHYLLTGQTQLSGKNLRGQDPQAATVEAILNAAAEAKANRLGASWFSFKDLEAIRDKAMALDPADRYQSMSDFASDLKRWSDGDAVEAYLEGKTNFLVKIAYQALIKAKQHPVGTAGLGLLGLSGLAVGSFINQGLKLEKNTVQTAREVTELGKSNNPEDWAKAELLAADHRAQAGLQNFNPLMWDALSSLERATDTSKARRKAHTEIFLPAYDAIAGSSNDFQTYNGKDATAKALEDVLDQIMPGHDQTGAAQVFLSRLEQEGYSAEDKRDIRTAVRDMLRNFALKLPWHPYLEFANKADANRLLQYLELSKEVAAPDLLPGGGASMAELFLERRAQKALGNIPKVVELDAVLATLEPQHVLDYYLLGRHQQVEERDYAKAAATFNRGAELEEKNRQELEDTGQLAKAELARARLYGMCYAKAGALRQAGDLSGARAEYVRCLEIAKSLKNLETKKNAMALALAQIAEVLRRERAGTDSQVALEYTHEIVNMFEEAIQISPNMALPFINYAVFYYNQKDFAKVADILQRALDAGHYTADTLISLAYAKARLGHNGEALSSIQQLLDLLESGREVSVNPNSNTTTLTRLVGLVNSRPELFNSIRLDQFYELTRTVCALATNMIEAGQIKEDQKQILMETSFTMLRIGLDRIARDNGYGKDIFFIRNFDTKVLFQFDRDRFLDLEKFLKQLPDVAEYEFY